MCGEVPLALLDAIRYLETQHDWMAELRQPARARLFSGQWNAGERAVAVVINLAHESRGMRWKRANASAVLALLDEPHQC